MSRAIICLKFDSIGTHLLGCCYKIILGHPHRGRGYFQNLFRKQILLQLYQATPTGGVIGFQNKMHN